MKRVLAIVILCLVAGSSAAMDPPAAAHVPATDFVPSRDMYVVENRSSRMWFGKAAVGVSTLSARYGSCAGIIESALVHHQARKGMAGGDPLNQPLSKLSADMTVKNPQGDTRFGFKVTQAMQRIAGDSKPEDVNYIGSDFRIKEKLKETRQPVILFLQSTKSGVYHEVAVYDYIEEGGKTRFKLADPNYPPGVVDEHGKPVADNRELVWDSSKKEFEKYDGEYGGLDEDKDDAIIEMPNDPISKEQREAYLKTLRDAATEYKLPDTVPSPSADQAIRVSNDPQVGGVLIDFDPALLEGAISDQELEDLEKRIVQFAESGQAGGIILHVRAVTEELHLLSLKALVESGAQTLGRLTRVRGYVLTPGGDLVLVGHCAEGKAAIPLDVFRVALDAVWRGGSHPFVSLDPNPENFAGAQKVRVGGVPKSAETTEFIRILLEADYLMKQLDLGTKTADAPGYKNFVTLAQESAEQITATANRMWLTPLPRPAGDIVRYKQDAGEVLLFQSDVQVMTEGMKLAGELLAGTGKADPLSAKAAENLTRCFPDLEKQYDEFYRLHAAFDVCKLCAIWRAQKLASPLLDKLLKVTPAAGLTRDSYEGIGPVIIQGTQFAVSGGAQTRARVAAGKAIYNDKLGPIGAAAADGFDDLGMKALGEFTLPGTLSFDAATAAMFNADTYLNRAIAQFAEADYDAALKQLDFALELDPDLGVAYAFRAVTNYSQGRGAAALEDINKAIAFDPTMLAFRAVLHSYAGRREQALQDARKAQETLGDNDQVLRWCAMASTFAGDLARTEQTINVLLARQPLDIAGVNAREQLELYYAMTPAQARKLIDGQRALPPAISDQFVEGFEYFSSMQFPAAIEAFMKCKALLAKPGRPPAGDSHIGELCDLLTILSQVIVTDQLRMAGNEIDALNYIIPADAASERLLSQHPDWASALLVRALVDAACDRDLAKVVSTYRQAAALAAKDPLLGSLGQAVSPQRLVARYGIIVWLHVDDQETPDAIALLDAIILALGDGMEARLMTALRDGFQSTKDATKNALRAAVAQIPDVIEPEAVRLLCLGLFYRSVLRMESEVGTEEQYREAAFKFLRITNFSSTDTQAISQISAFRLEAIRHLKDSFMYDFWQADRAVQLRKKAAEGTLEQDVAHKTLEELAEASIISVRKQGVPLLSRYFEMTLRDLLSGYENFLLQASWTHFNRNFKDDLDAESPAGKTQAATRARLDTWQDAINRRLNTLEGLGDLTILTRDLAGNSMTSVDVQSLTQLLYAIESGIGSRPLTPAVVEALRAQLAKMRADLSSRPLAAVAHDWDAWSRKTEPEPELPTIASGAAAAAQTPHPAAVPAGAPQAETASGVPWLYLGLGGVALAVVLLALAWVALRRKATPS